MWLLQADQADPQVDTHPESKSSNADQQCEPLQHSKMPPSSAKDLGHSSGCNGGSRGKESAGKAGDLGSIPGSGKSPEGNGNPLQPSCLEKSTDRGAWRASIHGATQSGARLTDRHVTSPGCSTQGFLGSRGTWLPRCNCYVTNSPVWESRRWRWRQFSITWTQRTEVKGHDPNSLTLQTHEGTQSFTSLQCSHSLHCIIQRII